MRLTYGKSTNGVEGEGIYPSAVWEKNPKVTVQEVLDGVAEQSYSSDEIGQIAEHFGVSLQAVITLIEANQIRGVAAFNRAQLPTGFSTINT